MDAPLTIRLFGPMLVLVGDMPLPRVRSRKALWLLALLATRANRPVAREWLAATLWPDVDLSTAFANLRPVLCELRHALRERSDRILTFDRNTIGLDLTDVDLDLTQFDSAMRQKDFDRAADLYRGPLLEDCNEEWVPQERTMREFECLRALQTLGERALETGDYERALAHFNRAVSIDAWRDAPRRGLMQAFAAKGDVNAALHVYREFTYLLSAHAATEPDPATSELYWHLRNRSKQGVRRPSPPKESPCPLCGLGPLTSEAARPAVVVERTYSFDAYRFFPERQLVLRGEEPLRIGARALDLLHLLIQRAGELVGKDELIRYGWPDTFVHENNLMVNISALRRALAPSNGASYIVTVPGRGYRFVGPLRTANPE